MSSNYWDEEPPITRHTEGEDKPDVESLREEISELRGMLHSRIDNAEEIAVADNRRAMEEQAAREAKAVQAANDPATIENLRKCETEEELAKFLREHGLDGRSL